MRQMDEILARFPGPVTLYVSRGRMLLRLALCIGLTAVGAWFLTPDDPKIPGYISNRWLAIMMGLTLAVPGIALTIGTVIALLRKRADSLQLDSQGFGIGSAFRRVRTAWQNVNAFRIQKTYPDGWPGPSANEIWYEVFDADRCGVANATRVLSHGYGEPMLRDEELVALMNEWRRRALAQGSATVDSSAQAEDRG
jgi:hypothetical protein